MKISAIIRRTIERILEKEDGDVDLPKRKIHGLDGDGRLVNWTRFLQRTEVDFSESDHIKKAREEARIQSKVRREGTA